MKKIKFEDLPVHSVFIDDEDRVSKPVLWVKLNDTDAHSKEYGCCHFPHESLERVGQIFFEDIKERNNHANNR